MTVETQAIPARAGDHVVTFYQQELDLAQTVGSYLIDAARDGAVAVVVATKSHRRSFEAELEAAGIDPADGCRAGTLVWLDAAATLSRFMPGGQIDGDAFHRVIGTALREAAEADRPVRVYGEMVALLWDAGDVLAAIDLEELWNDLGRELRFSLLCAYHCESIVGSEHAAALRRVCQHHSRVLRAPMGKGSPAPTRRSVDTEVSGHFPATSDAPGAARRLVVKALRELGHDGAVLADVQLVLSELATNAVVHARSPFSVVARFEDSGVRVSVHDASRTPPTLRDGGPLAESGRGLRLVAALASGWGVEVKPEGKTVWAKLDLSGRPRGAEGSETAA